MAESGDETGQNTKGIFNHLHTFVDSNLRYIRTGLYVVCGAAIVIIGRSIYVTRVFVHAEDVPAKFLHNHMRLLGKTLEVKDGVLKVQHIPPLKVPFRKQKQGEGLLVKLACLDISPEGKLWMSDKVTNQKIWFKLLHRDVSVLHCSVEIPKMLRNLNINEELMKRGLCKVSSPEHLEGDYSTTTSTNKTLVSYIDRMVYLESRAARKGAGMWKVNKPLVENSWKATGVRAVKSIVACPVTLLKWVFNKYKQNKK